MEKKTDDTPGKYNTLDPLTFQADHHTDLWIARRVMEWPDVKESEPLHDYFHFGGAIMGGNRPISFRYGTISDLFQPSSRMEDAVQVLSKMRVLGWQYVMASNSTIKNGIQMTFIRPTGESYGASADTESLAVCRAAGLAVTGRPND